MSELPRLVATDCDGTLLRSDGTASERTRRTLHRLDAAGVQLVLVTARPPRWVDVLRDLAGEQGIVLCGNGAFTYDVAAGVVVAHRLIEPALVTELLRDIRDALPEVLFAAEGLDGLAREPGYERSTGDLGQLADRGELGRRAAGKILVRHPSWSADEVWARTSAVVGDRAEVSHSGGTGLAELAAPGVSKGLALSAWCAEHGIESAHVWAFGDMPNDLPMLRWAGRSFAVANAHPDVIAAATDLTAANNDDGVAVALDEMLADQALR